MLKNKAVISIISLVVLLVVIFGIYEIYVTDKAHKTFENYYAFRGCIQMMSRTADSGTCKTGSGQTIKIVKFNDQWYLDGDLPTCWNNICF